MGEEWWVQLQLQKPPPPLTSWICVEQQGVPRPLSSFSGEVRQAEMEETEMEMPTEDEGATHPLDECEEQTLHVMRLDYRGKSEGGILHWRVAE